MLLYLLSKTDNNYRVTFFILDLGGQLFIQTRTYFATVFCLSTLMLCVISLRGVNVRNVHIQKSRWTVPLVAQEMELDTLLVLKSQGA